MSVGLTRRGWLGVSRDGLSARSADRAVRHVTLGQFFFERHYVESSRDCNSKTKQPREPFQQLNCEGNPQSWVPLEIMPLLDGLPSSSAELQIER